MREVERDDDDFTELDIGGYEAFQTGSPGTGNNLDVFVSIPPTMLIVSSDLDQATDTTAQTVADLARAAVAVAELTAHVGALAQLSGCRRFWAGSRPSVTRAMTASAASSTAMSRTSRSLALGRLST